MIERLLIVLAVTGGVRAIAFVNSGWVSSTSRRADPIASTGWRGLNAHTLALDVASYMIPHPEKVARGETFQRCPLRKALNPVSSRGQNKVL